MVKRFLLYSLAHNRPVKVLLADTLKYKNITVITMEEDRVGFLAAGRKTPQILPLDQILSASYARGDDGDTLKYVASKEQCEKNDEENQGTLQR